MLVASTGGHLKQLHRLHRRLADLEGPFRWATFDTPQSRSLLAGEQVDYVRFVGGRDPFNALSNAPAALRIYQDDDVRTVVSTGSAVALPFFALARARGVEAHYIESAARSDGPSTTARIISRIPGVELYTQYSSWAGGGWRYSGSVFDSFAPGPPATSHRPKRIATAVVSLGTFRDIGFARLLRRLLDFLPPETEILWQTGDTDVTGLGIRAHREIPERDLTQAMAEADVVVAHAGVGTALAAIENGKCPVLVPRRLAHGEHVDDHQIQIAAELDRRGLALSVDADDLGMPHLLEAAGRHTTTLADEPPFQTVDPPPDTLIPARYTIGWNVRLRSLHR